jgi:PAS domain S-box-containing protein
MAATNSRSTANGPTTTPPAFHHSIQFRLAVFVSLLVIVALGVLSVAGYAFARRTLRQQIRERLSVVANDRRELLNSYIEQQILLIGQITSRRQVRIELAAYANGTISADETHRRIKERLVDAISSAKELRAAWISDRTGKVITATDEQYLGQDFSADPDFQQGLNEKHFGVPRGIGAAVHVYLAGPVDPIDGKELGVVMVLVEPQSLVRILSDSTGLGDTGEVLVGTRDGDKVRYVLRPPRHLEVNGGDLERVSHMARAFTGETGFVTTADYRGVPVSAAFQPVGYRDWGIVAKMDEAEAYQPIRELKRLLLVTLAAVLVFVLGGSYFLATRFTRPILKLAEAASSVARGDFEARVHVGSSDEIGRLARGFNRMTEELAATYANLERRVAERPHELEASRDLSQTHAEELLRSKEALLKQSNILESVLANMGDGVVVADEKGKFLIFNPAAERIVGIGPTESSPDEWSRQYGLFLPDTVTPFPTDQLPLVRAIRGEDAHEVEIYVRNASLPEGVWISASARPFRDEHGTVRGGIAVFRDITEHKRSEQRLASQYAITRVLADSLTLNDAAPRILQVICETLGWEMGALWSVSESDNLLRCVETWHHPGVDIATFEQRTREVTFPPGVGLPGRVWKSRQPAWISDVTADSNFPRAAFATQANVHGAFGFPILLQDSLLGVVEFFSHEIRRPDENLLTMFTAIGTQIGQFIDRKRAEEQLLRVSRAVEQSANLVLISDPTGKIEYVNPKFTEVSGYLPQEVIGKNPRILKSGRTPPEEYKRLWETITAGRVWRGEFLNRKKNGEHYWASASISPVRSPRGEITHFVAVEEDITELKQAEQLLRESEERLQAILDNSTAVIYVKAIDHRYILVNKRYETLFHVTREQLKGKTDADLFPPDMVEKFWANDRKVLEARQALEFEEIAPHDDGLHTYISIKFPLFDAAGEPYAVCGISTDITERKRTEDKLVYERYLLESLMDNVPDAIYFKDARSRFIRINRALAEKNGLAGPDEAIGKTDFDFFTPDHAQPAFDDEQEVMRTGVPIIAKEEKETWPDGRVTWVVTTKLPLRDTDGKVVGTLGISRDITKRKQAEQALRDSEALYHSLVESLPLNVFRKDLDGRLTFANSLYAKTLGRPLEELLGKTDHDLFPKQLADKYRSDDRRVTETGCLFETVEEHQTPRGERLFVQVLKCPVLDSQGKIVGTQVIFWDVTARKRAEEALQHSERRYRQFTEASQDAIVVANQHGVITLFNAAAQRTFGYTEEEVLGKPVTILMPTEFQESHREGFARYLATREAHVVGRTVELRGQRKNGEIFHLDLSLTALDLPEGISFLAAIRDTTERHRMQARVIQTEHMASLGEMSAGIAHEINNPLAFVANNLAVLERDIKGLRALLAEYDRANEAIRQTRPELAQKIERIAEEIDLDYLNQNVERILDSTRQGVKRVADIVQNLRKFSRVDQLSMDRVDIHEAITSSLEMIQGRLERRNIVVEKNFAQLPAIACSPAQLNQVFLNLLVNAMQAIEATRKPAGRIEITTWPADGQVVVEIADDGCGIPPEAVPKIFNPFFTTKKIGEGTGLGLSITHGIVTDHHGEIEVESTVGQGTRFRVILPINPKEKTP